MLCFALHIPGGQFWPCCPRTYQDYPIIIPSWYVHGHKACGPDPGGEPYFGSFHCCRIGPLPAGAKAGGEGCDKPGECASGLCLPGGCSD
jgi:hypothetical protein